MAKGAWCSKHLESLAMLPRPYARLLMRILVVATLALVAGVVVTRLGSVSGSVGRLRGTWGGQNGQGDGGDYKEDGAEDVQTALAFSPHRKPLTSSNEEPDQQFQPRHRAHSADDANGGASRSKRRKKNRGKGERGASHEGGSLPGAGLQQLDISVNEEYHVTGLYRTEDKEAFLPFKFVKKYFDIYGDIKTASGKSVLISGKSVLKDTSANTGPGGLRLSFSHSYGKPFTPPKSYKHTASGQFLNFGGFNVAGRERVLYVDESNVPVSAQWDPKGYHFATQISQYGLQHYSAMVNPKNITSPLWLVEPKAAIDTAGWVAHEGNQVKAVKDDALGQIVLQFCTEVPPIHLTSISGISHRMKKQDGSAARRVPLINYKLTGKAMAITFRVMTNVKRLYTLHYDTTATKTLEVQSESMRYRLVASPGKWQWFARDLQNDLQRAIVYQLRSKDSTKPMRESASSNVKVSHIQAVVLRGCGQIAEMSLRSEAHLEMGGAAVKWIVENQDPKTGGWPTNATRSLKPDLVLKPGWLSAMVQGQAMSLLVRAYYATKDRKYLDSALRATQPFHKLAKDGGVKAVFLNTYTWYEEYPTQPPSFVLNGFIFSLLGLYDVAEAAHTAGVECDAQQLYQDGLKSLRALAMLYDTGAGTIYDLRHVSIPTFPPNRARWDYHVTHINLMTAMSTIDTDPVFTTLRERWLGYMSGHATKHN